MANILPRELTVLVDNREKYPVLFPKTLVCWELGKRHMINITAKIAKLDAGDYLLEGYETLCIIERKGSASEVITNLFTKDQTRQAKSFAKLKNACDHPTIMLEMTPAQLATKSKHMPDVDGSILLSKLMAVIALNKFHLLWLPWGRGTLERTRLGEVILHQLIGHVLANAVTQPNRSGLVSG